MENADLQKAIAEVINRSLNGLDTAASFVKDQLPDVVSQLLVWTIAVNITHIILWLILLLFTTWYGRRLTKDGIKHFIPYKGFTLRGIFHIFMVCALLITIPAMVIPAITETVKVIVAPKLFLVDYVADFARANKR